METMLCFGNRVRSWIALQIYIVLVLAQQTFFKNGRGNICKRSLGKQMDQNLNLMCQYGGSVTIAGNER